MRTNKKRFNKGNKYGRGLIKHSLQKLGCGRSILADKDGVILCGNDVYEMAKELGIKTVTIETEGDVLVVVKRTDVSVNEKKGLELALVDNLSQEKNIDWDTETVLEIVSENLSFDPREWGGYECMVRDLKLEDLFKEDFLPKTKKEEISEFSPNKQLLLFE